MFCDLRKNEELLHLNASCDTTEFACESTELWWREQGQCDDPDADELLIPCDGGGSNRASAYIFNEDLQALSNRLRVKIRIAHYPPYCSKHNPIENRVFPHVTRACKGVPLDTIETAKHYMEKTKTTKRAESRCPNHRQGLRDRPQIRHRIQKQQERPVQRSAPKMELLRPPTTPLKTEIDFRTIS